MLARRAPTPPDSGRSVRAGVDETNVEAALRTAADTLRGAGLEAPRTEALALLVAATGLPRASLLAHPEWPLSAATLGRLEAMVARRAGREPFAYVVGEREFYGRPFRVDRRVLSPRPETEQLVERALERLDALRARGVARPLVVDVGTGSGAIAISVALERPFARVVATDRSIDALAVARDNARRHEVAERVRFLCADLLAPVRGPIDIVLANLPYVPSAEIDALMPEVCAYEPRVALDGGADGTSLIAALLAELPGRLAPGGLALLEIGHGQGQRVAALARAALPDAVVAVLPDLAGLERVLRVERPAP